MCTSHARTIRGVTRRDADNMYAGRLRTATLNQSSFVVVRAFDEPARRAEFIDYVTACLLLYNSREITAKNLYLTMFVG